MLRPVRGGDAGLQGVLELPAGPFDHAIALRMVCRGGVVVHVDDVAGPVDDGEEVTEPLLGDWQWAQDIDLVYNRFA